MKTLLFTEQAGRTFSGSIHPALKYLPLAFLMSWHYCLWFTPNAFPSANSLLSNIVTQCWLICLGVSGVLLLVIPRLLGRDRYLSRYRSLYYLAPLISIFGGLALSFWTMALSSPISSWIISVLIGASFAVQWLLLGEFYARTRAAFSLNHVCVIVPIVLFAAKASDRFFPPWPSRCSSPCSLYSPGSPSSPYVRQRKMGRFPCSFRGNPRATPARQ